MGCFDIFVGKAKCPICGELNEFEEQTKDYNCFLEHFKLGDYIDNKNRTYVYTTDNVGVCSCGNYKINIVIKNGQIVGFYNDIEIGTLDIEKLENIEDGLARRLERDERVKVAYGFDDTKLYTKANFDIGSVVTFLDDLWTIEAIYKEELTTDNGKCQFLYETWYRNNFVYVVKNNKGLERLLVTRENDLDWLYEVNLEPECYCEEACESDEHYNSIYTIQYGCVLKTIKGGDNAEYNL